MVSNVWPSLSAWGWPCSLVTSESQPPEPGNRESSRRGGRTAPPPSSQPGQLLPPSVRSRLRLTEEQEQQLTNLEREVKERLAKLLTPEQQKQFADLRLSQPPGPPPDGFPDGPPPGGPGGPPEGPPPEVLGTPEARRPEGRSNVLKHPEAYEPLLRQASASGPGFLPGHVGQADAGGLLHPRRRLARRRQKRIQCQTLPGQGHLGRGDQLSLCPGRRPRKRAAAGEGPAGRRGPRPAIRSL